MGSLGPGCPFWYIQGDLRTCCTWGTGVWAHKAGKGARIQEEVMDGQRGCASAQGIHECVCVLENLKSAVCLHQRISLSSIWRGGRGCACLCLFFFFFMWALCVRTVEVLLCERSCHCLIFLPVSVCLWDIGSALPLSEPIKRKEAAMSHSLGPLGSQELVWAQVARQEQSWARKAGGSGHTLHFS